MHIDTDPADHDIDETYEMLIRGFGQAGPARQMDFAASMLLILCNHVNDSRVITDAVRLSLQNIEATSD